MKLPPLDDSERPLWFRWGCVLAIGACALAPIAGTPSLTAARGRERPGMPFAPLESFRLGPRIAIRRDPFVPTIRQLPADARVEAVILGARPQALLRIKGRTSIVGVGDFVEGARVVGIDEEGVLFADSTRLLLERAP
jgi:hypothetical protein